MADREKVIKGLEWCMNERHDCYREKGCPYENVGDDVGCKYALHMDALALLKAQEAVVMAGTELTEAELIEKIRKAPIVLKLNVDAVPVKHGRWVADSDGLPVCSVCNAVAMQRLHCNTSHRPWMYDVRLVKTPYCPDCGARMDGE